MTTRDERDLTQHITADFGRKVRRMVQESRRTGEVRVVTRSLKETNLYLADEARYARDLRRSVASSTAVERGVSTETVERELRTAQEKADAVQRRSDLTPDPEDTA